MDNKIGFGKFNAVIPSNNAYRNFRALELALKSRNNKVSITHFPVTSWDNYEVQISHPDKKFENKLKKSVNILLEKSNDTTSALYKLSKVLGIPKKLLAEAANKISGIVYQKMPIDF